MASTTVTLACTVSSSLASMLLLVRTTGCGVVIMEILAAGMWCSGRFSRYGGQLHGTVEEEVNVRRSFRGGPERRRDMGLLPGELRWIR